MVWRSPPLRTRRSRIVADSGRRHHSSEGTPIQPRFEQEKVNDLLREVIKLSQQVGQLEKRLDKTGSVLRAVYELVSVELQIEPDVLAETLAAVIREKAERAEATCAKCNRPLGDKTKCIYCGEERPAESIFDVL